MKEYEGKREIGENFAVSQEEKEEDLALAHPFLNWGGCGRLSRRHRFAFAIRALPGQRSE